MKSQTKTAIRGGRVLDIQRSEAPFRDVIIQGNRIVSLEPPGASLGEDFRILDASDRMLMPGLVNSHTHGHGALGKGRGDRWTLEMLLNAGPWITGKRTLEDKRLSAQLNAAEMVLKGCTSCYDLYFEFPTPSGEGIDAVALGYSDVGFRATIAPMVADRTLYEAMPGLIDALPDGLRRSAEKIRLAPTDAVSRACREVLTNWPHDRDRLRPAIAPTIPQHCSDDLLRFCRSLASEHGAGMHMHLSESRAQSIKGFEIYGKSQAAHIRDLGLLGPDFVAAHCVWLDNEDIKILSDGGAGISHQPICNLRIGSGIAPVRKFLDAGIAVGIGTDGSNASDHQNMFESARTAANVSRIVEADYRRWISTREALTLATSGAAELLGFSGELGALAPGFLADIVFLNLDSVNFLPFNNPVNQIVNSEEGLSVHSVMIDGNLVLRGREFEDFDLDELRKRVEAAIARLDEATLKERYLAEKLEPFVGTFCAGLRRTPSDAARCGN